MPTISITQPSDSPVWWAMPLVEHVPRRQPEPGGDEHADAEAEQCEPDDAAGQPLDRPIARAAVRHAADPTDAPCHTLLVLIPPCCFRGSCRCCSPAGARRVARPVLRCVIGAGSRWHRSASSARPRGIVAAFPFDGVARQLIVALKFRHRRCAADVLAAQMVRRLLPRTLSTSSPGRPPAPVVCAGAATTRPRSSPVRWPSSSAFRAVGCCIGRTARPRPASPDPSASPARPFVPGDRGRGSAVLLVDDVVTTGATLRSAADALLAAGVAEVELAAVASTQRRPPVGSLPAWASSIASSALVKARS